MFQILLDLSDSEYEAGLGISHPMHRKKLRLAVEEKRHLPVGTKSLLDDFDTVWVVEDWLQDIGLPQVCFSLSVFFILFWKCIVDISSYRLIQSRLFIIEGQLRFFFIGI